MYERYLEILSIDLTEHELNVLIYTVNQTFNSSGLESNWVLNMPLSGPYVFSHTQNKFFVLGCYTLGYITGGAKTGPYATGCVSFCGNGLSSITNGSCDGVGCCQTSIPKGLTNYNLSFDQSFTDASVAYDAYSPCNYAFVANASWFNFTSADLLPDFGINNKDQVPVVLDWAIRDNKTCQDARAEPESYACRSSNSLCEATLNGEGYECSCSEGYYGNAYLIGGCKDVNECDAEFREQYECYGSCTNLEGSYNCSCPDGTTGNATVKGGCLPIHHQSKFPLGAKIAVGISAFIMVVVSATSSIILSCLRRKHKKEREMFFKQNGGLVLYEKMRSNRVDTVQIFSKEELEKATDYFDESKIIGCGGRGMVYKGILADGRVVAIKKSRVFDEDQKEEFVNEMIILSEINHRNVVKLLGCCLEVDVPMLVYEFVAKGSLHGVLHDRNEDTQALVPVKLGLRLQIAAESAEALSYLHSSISRSIVHGDVKSQNILLDQKFTARVSDFGASQLVPLDETEFLLFVQGTLGYLDPECMLTHRLTDKSDVYSFGVVLVELLTRKMAIYMDNTSGQKKNLSSTFIEAMKEDKLRDILDGQMVEEAELEIIQQVAELAKQCLCVKGEERPTMREVSERLYSLMTHCKQHPWRRQAEAQEEESLLPNTHTRSEYNAGDANFTTNTTTDFQELKNELGLKIKEGR